METNTIELDKLLEGVNKISVEIDDLFAQNGKDLGKDAILSYEMKHLMYSIRHVKAKSYSAFSRLNELRKDFFETRQKLIVEMTKLKVRHHRWKDLCITVIPFADLEPTQHNTHSTNTTIKRHSPASAN